MNYLGVNEPMRSNERCHFDFFWFRFMIRIWNLVHGHLIHATCVWNGSSCLPRWRGGCHGRAWLSSPCDLSWQFLMASLRNPLRKSMNCWRLWRGKWGSCTISGSCASVFVGFLEKIWRLRWLRKGLSILCWVMMASCSANGWWEITRLWMTFCNACPTNFTMCLGSFVSHTHSFFLPCTSNLPLTDNL